MSDNKTFRAGLEITCAIAYRLLNVGGQDKTRQCKRQCRRRERDNARDKKDTRKKQCKRQERDEKETRKKQCKRQERDKKGTNSQSTAYSLQFDYWNEGLFDVMLGAGWECG